MFLNLLWLISGSGLALLGSLILSSHLSVDQFGVITGLFSLTTLLSAICSRGQQGIILSLSPGVSKSTIKRAVLKISPLLCVCLLAFVLNHHFRNTQQSTYLFSLMPFVAIGVFTQILMGINQANNKLTYLGLYQSLPSLARSIPALLLLAAYLYSNKTITITIEKYFTLNLGCTLIILFSIIFILFKTYKFNEQASTAVKTEKTKSENYFWATSVLSSSYVSLIAPVVLFSWGEFSAGIFGIYILFWNVTNIVISAIYNNFLLPGYAKIRNNPAQCKEHMRNSLTLTIATSIIIAASCTTLFYLCTTFVWPAEYKEHQVFFFLALISLVIRPFSARLGLPFNFSELIRCKTKIQITSLLVLLAGSIIFSASRNHNLLAMTLILSELVVLFLYAHNKRELHS
ncbi:hypothetical protein ACQKP5_15520 [Pseudomonas vancouverensis]|uniref:hypothetical protein n=1 Tax=Pseudomonas vancouverensis TaxID=95300 RepID=UPI003D06A201